MIMILCIKFGWIEWKLGEEQSFNKIMKLEILQSAPQIKLKESGIKSTLHICTVEHQVPHFRPFCYTINRFHDIPHFRFSQWLTC